jgi:hypothetical protein
MATVGNAQQEIVTRLRELPTAAISGADGMVAVPAAEARPITETAERTEADIVAAARAGSTLCAAREIFGYRTLQTRQR